MALSAKQKLREPFDSREKGKHGTNYECFSVADEAYMMSGPTSVDSLMEGYRPYAIIMCLVSLAATLGLAVVGLVYALDERNDALFGFGATCVLDFLSTAFVLWRFKPAKRASSAAYELERERVASLRIAILFIVAFFVILGKCVYHLVMATSPSQSRSIVIISGVSVAVCVVLGTAKVLLAKRILSPSMRTDGVNSFAGAIIALGGVISYYVYSLYPSVWYISTVIGMLIATALLVMGIASTIRLRKVRPSEAFPY